jgi:hypothetical protein
MTHQFSAESLALILIDNSGRDFDFARLHYDVARAADNHPAAIVFGQRRQRDVIDEIDVRNNATSRSEK